MLLAVSPSTPKLGLDSVAELKSSTGFFSGSAVDSISFAAAGSDSVVKSGVIYPGGIPGGNSMSNALASFLANG